MSWWNLIIQSIALSGLIVCKIWLLLNLYVCMYVCMYVICMYVCMSCWFVDNDYINNNNNNCRILLEKIIWPSLWTHLQPNDLSLSYWLFYWQLLFLHLLTFFIISFSIILSSSPCLLCIHRFVIVSYIHLSYFFICIGVVLPIWYICMYTC